jgi:hypothetical protein
MLRREQCFSDDEAAVGVIAKGYAILPAPRGEPDRICVPA